MEGAAGTTSPSSGLLGYCGAGASRPELSKSPYGVKHRLVRSARGALRAAMGSRYAEVVETCLACLDEDNANLGDENGFNDGDGVAVGVRYIEKVIGKLGEIVV